MQRLIETLLRLRRGHPWLTDLLLVVLVAVPPVIHEQPGWRPVWVQTSVYVALVLPLLWRRRRPVLVAALVTVAFWVQHVGEVWGHESGRGAVALAAVLITLTVRGLRRAAAATVLGVAGCVLLWIPAWQRDNTGPDARDVWLTPLALGLLLFGAWVFGEYVRARRAYVAECERRAALAESERLALARVAVAEERARIAREIHDVLAHSVSVMVLNAEGGRMMRTVDPAAVDSTLDVISATGREALDELRRLLDVLRTPDGDGDGGVPGVTGDAGHAGAVPTLSADLGRLVGRLNTSGTRAGLDLRGDQGGLPPGLTAQTYRIVQEALTNVVKHAPPDATIRVRVDTGTPGPGRQVRVRVENSAGAGGGALPGRPTPVPALSGHGLTGMRERTALYGGSVDAGPTPGGGYRVTATLRATAPGPTAGRATAPGSAAPGSTGPGPVGSGSTPPAPTAGRATALGSTAPGLTGSGSTGSGSTAPGLTAPGLTAPGLTAAVP
ncbi:sensor histidine kinase [Streptomyces liangshanensis]|uniref:histidine kinase n=1 Tax=Streptomyces liangshanensis TaxID=2717324 RepID=A0A6G9H6A0_9ACTN|nr:histidine kinase [Streptomyces liangshanensis]QIQ06065.1 sensor histidine kinase [Streptomyces liangshanensis]